MTQGIPEEGVPLVVPTEAEVAPSSYVGVGRESKAEDGKASGPVVYFPNKMPTDKEEYQRVLESIYMQAGKIVQDHAEKVEIEKGREEFLTLEKAKEENLSELAKMNAQEGSQLGFFTRLGNWIRGEK